MTTLPLLFTYTGISDSIKEQKDKSNSENIFARSKSSK